MPKYIVLMKANRRSREYGSQVIAKLTSQKKRAVVVFSEESKASGITDEGLSILTQIQHGPMFRKDAVSCRCVHHAATAGQ